MQKIDRYILLQMASTFSFFLIVLTLIFWTNRAIRLFDKLISKGHDSSVLFKFALLSLPSTATIVFPLACLAAAVFITNRLKLDTEVIILQNSGLSPWRIAKPFFIFGMFSMIVLGLITTVLLPHSKEELHKNQIELDNSLSARLLKEGKFIHPLKGVTFYIKKIDTDGTLQDILLHDRRNKDEIHTYTANLAFLAKNEYKTVLYMENGLIQSIRTEDLNLSTTKFESVAIDLSKFIDKKVSDRVYLSHLPTWLLIKSFRKNSDLAKFSRPMINLELHTRLHRPIFCFVATILGFACLMLGNHTRFGLGKQICLVLAAILIIKIIESYTTNLAISNHLLWPSIYLPSFIGIFISVLLLKISSGNFRLNGRN
ncbi:MAG: LPS export ABC transporter permease LptF [Rhodobacteraceae bacterium TMED111]|nr:LPS export ABC transporter permease LptF [Marinovum sp.]OUV45044.1 MAG: LPS export ABC transporter permease LptF [Rhodobacteraceae bacterium TMED111]